MQISQVIRERLTKTIEKLHRRRWCDGTGGNFSVVVQKDPVLLLMAPSGVDKGSLQPEQLLVVNEFQEVLDGAGKASAETQLHLAIIHKTGAGAVLHTHSVTGTVLSRRHAKQGQIRLQGLEMLKGLNGIHSHNTHVDLPVVGNNQNINVLAEDFHQEIQHLPQGILVEGHGLYAWGEDLQQAERHVEIIEFLLDVQLQEQQLRSQP